MALREQINQASENVQRRLTRAEAAATGAQLEERLVTPRRGRRGEAQRGVLNEERQRGEDEQSHIPQRRLAGDLNRIDEHDEEEEDEEWGGIGDFTSLIASFNLPKLCHNSSHPIRYQNT